MKKMPRTRIKNEQSKKKQGQIRVPPRYSKKRFTGKDNVELPFILNPNSPNSYSKKKKSIMLKQNLNINNLSGEAKNSNQYSLYLMRNKLQLITKKTQNVQSKYSKNSNLNKFLIFDIKPQQKAKKQNSPHQIYKNSHQPNRPSYPYISTRVQTNHKAQSFLQTHDGIYRHIKSLFNHIQKKLKATKNDNMAAKSVEQYYHAHSYKQLITSKIISTGLSKSVMTSPRSEILEQKKKKRYGGPADKIGEQIDKLEQLQIKNEGFIKMFLNQSIGLLNLQLYRERLKDKQKM